MNEVGNFPMFEIRVRRESCHHLVKGDAKAPDVNRVPVLTLSEDFWRHPGYDEAALPVWSAQYSPALPFGRVVELNTETEICKLDSSVGG